MKSFYLVLCAILSILAPVAADSFDEFFKSSEAFKRAHVGICILDIETEKEIYTSHAEQFFVPASLQKIPLSVTAFSILGDDFSFQTTLGLEGFVDQEGVLHGNLVVQGGGDPTLSLTIFSEWEECLKKQGIRSIDGKIIVDTSVFETAMASPFWYFEDLGNYFGAGACGLSINKNSYKITFKPGKNEGDPATVVQLDPPIPYLTFHNEVTTGSAGSGDQAYVFGSEYSPTQFYRGTVPLDHETFTIRAAIPDPALFCGMTLAEKIPVSQGVEVVKTKRPQAPQLHVLHQKKSPPMKKILEDLNHFSINLYAEHLLKTIGHGMAAQGMKKMETLLKESHVPAHVRDGAGIARTNLITPKGFTKLLCTIRKNPLYTPIYDSFPPIGKGSLVSFSPVPGASVRAKTGSMNMTSNLGGFLKLDSGKEFAFCVCCNNYVGSLKDVIEETHRLLVLFSSTEK